MSDWTRIILTALGTISGGVVVYVVGQLIQKLFRNFEIHPGHLLAIKKNRLCFPSFLRALRGLSLRPLRLKSFCLQFS